MYSKKYIKTITSFKFSDLLIQLLYIYELPSGLFDGHLEAFFDHKIKNAGDHMIFNNRINIYDFIMQ